MKHQNQKIYTIIKDCGVRSSNCELEINISVHCLVFIIVIFFLVQQFIFHVRFVPFFFLLRTIKIVLVKYIAILVGNGITKDLLESTFLIL